MPCWIPLWAARWARYAPPDKINLVRGMTPETGEVRTEGWVVHGGRRTATAEGRITDAAGRLIGHGSTTCIILS